MSTPDISQLTATQQEALQTYTSVTDQDPLAAIAMLQRAEWNVQIAIARFFDGEPTTDALAEARAAMAPVPRQTTNLQYEALLDASRPSASASRPPEDRVEKIDTAASGTTHQQPSFLLSALLVPFHLAYRIFGTLLAPFGFLVPTIISRLLSRLLTQRSRPVRRALPPGDNARRFIREFGETYGDNSLPFVESGFNLTLDNAKKDLKYLLVVLLSPDHDDNETWVRETLLSSELASFLASHKDEVVLWGGNVQDAEAYQVSSSLNCTKFPFAALICQTSDTGSSAMTVVMRAAGPMAAGELVAKLGSAMSAQQTQLRTARSQRSEQQVSRNLRQEQDSAYERSLAQDRERARVRREEQQAREQAEAEAKAAAKAKEDLQLRTEQWRRWRAQSLPQEPGAEVKDAVRVSIRLPSGERVIRKFQPDATVEELYAFIDCHGILDGQSSSERATEPSTYTHKFGFRVVSPMPRVVYAIEDGVTIGDKIGKGANLIVEPIIDEEGEEGA
ncbi:UBX domain-containing protein 10 [Cyphellophora attinorum]|uniref:UBX domain-containing protein 10 n=1 Tax=Cyphellophora attinorum TaxID=1664694 RepID=A0A0N1HZ31_9EURO|nr:UBX domain-containing protein 10 [Phialophora attinorum]KPI43916.1 UBX domain-containing protein 10 [Phialophora attinorum]